MKTFFLSALLTFPAVMYAQEFQNPLIGVTSIASAIEALLRVTVYILFPVAVLFIVYSGFKFILAQGNSDELKKAKLNFLWTIVGLTLLLGAWALALLIKGTIDPLLRV
tara:strand:+ start:17992 stop:18318 length:327 start_codon:yes stop_codon:yes gene_type:complete